MAKLTKKQKLFVEEYLVDLNATQAAIRAGYSPKTSRFIGNENLTKPNIQERIQKQMDERSKRTGITQDMVLEELAKVAFADIKDFLSFRTALRVIGYEDGEPITDYTQIINMKDSDQVDGRMIQEVSINSKGVFSFKLHDKMAALDKLGKHLKLFTEKVEITDTTPNPYADLTTEELKMLIYGSK